MEKKSFHLMLVKMKKKGGGGGGGGNYMFGTHFPYTDQYLVVTYKICVVDYDC